MRFDSSGPAAAACRPDIRRVVILGHTGFIGTKLEIFFRACSPKTELLGISIDDPASSIDLTRSDALDRVPSYFDSQTAVIMLSAIKRQLGDNLDNFLKNLAMVSNICRILQDRSVGRFVYFSSSAVYGEDIHNTRITEETPVQPTSYYGMAKYAAERLFQKAVEKQNPKCLLILRPVTVYGPGEPETAYSPGGFITSIQAGKPISLWGDGTERREFLFIEDLVALTHRLTFHAHFGVVNLACGRSQTFQEVLSIASKILQVPLEPGSRPRSKSKVDHGFENDLLRNLVPGFSFTPLEDGMRRIAAAGRRPAAGR